MANWIMDHLSVDSYIRSIMNNLLEQKEEYIKTALIELISRDLIVIEQTQPILIRSTDSQGKEEFKLQQGVRFVPKEFEYIKKLEAENKELKEKLEAILGIVK